MNKIRRPCNSFLFVIECNFIRPLFLVVNGSITVHVLLRDHHLINSIGGSVKICVVTQWKRLSSTSLANHLFRYVRFTLLTAKIELVKHLYLTMAQWLYNLKAFNLSDIC